MPIVESENSSTFKAKSNIYGCADRDIEGAYYRALLSGVPEYQPETWYWKMVGRSPEGVDLDDKNSEKFPSVVAQEVTLKPGTIVFKKTKPNKNKRKSN